MKNSCFFVKLLIEIFNKNSIVGEKFTAFCMMGYMHKQLVQAYFNIFLSVI